MHDAGPTTFTHATYFLLPRPHGTHTRIFMPSSAFLLSGICINKVLPEPPTACRYNPNLSDFPTSPDLLPRSPQRRRRTSTTVAMAVSYRTGISILQFIYFVPAAALALFLCFRHGWKSASASWRFIVTLALLRVAGDIVYFVALKDPSIEAYVAVIICDLMGLAPLTLTCVGLLGRV